MTAKTAAALAVIFTAAIIPAQGQEKAGPSPDQTTAADAHEKKDKSKEKGESSSSSSSHGGGGGGGTSKPQQPAFWPQPVMPSASESGHKESGEKHASGHENESAEAAISGTPVPNNSIPDDPVELANRLVRLLEGGDDVGGSAPKPEKPPLYVDDLEASAEAGDAPAQCWYAVWLLSEGTDPAIPRKPTIPRQGDNADTRTGRETYDQAVSLLDQSASSYPPAKTIEKILDGRSFSAPEDEDDLKTNGDGELFYYLGKAFLTGRNIITPEVDVTKKDPSLAVQRTMENRVVAFQVLKFASALGSPSAKLQLALMYASGIGAPRDAARAFELAKAAAITTPPEIGARDGLPVKNFEASDSLATKAQAERQLATFYMTGTGTDSSEDNAAKHIEAAEKYTSQLEPPGQ